MTISLENFFFRHDNFHNNQCLEKFFCFFEENKNFSLRFVILSLGYEREMWHYDN